MFELARGYRDRGMAAYSELQQAEFAAEQHGYTATRHQREVGTGYFDQVAEAISGGTSSTLALEGSTEAAQFTAAGRTGATHAAEQVQAALHEDHGRIEALVDRLAAAKDVTAITGALEPLTQLLTEHFAHEEHQKGFYGLLSATSPEYRAQVAADDRRAPAAPADAAGAPRAHEGPDDALGSRRAHAARSAAASATTRRAR